MKKFIALIIIIGLTVAGFNYKSEIKNYLKNLTKSNEKILREEPKILREYPPKKVEVFKIGKNQANISFIKTGTVKTNSEAFIIPQITGKITTINIKIGDKVNKNETLIELGDSLSTDIMDIQFASAEEGEKIARETKNLTKKLNIQSLKSAQISIKSAKKTYENAKLNQSNTKDLFDLQIQSAELGLETAENTYDELKDAYSDAKDTLYDIEDTYELLNSTIYENTEILKKLEQAVTLYQLEQAIGQTKAQIETLKSSKKNTKNGVEQTELNLEQLESTIATQLDQLDYAIEMAYLQYQSAINQLEALIISTQLQELGMDGQIIQADSALEMASLNKEYKNVKSPINGIITSLTAEEGDLTSPGQILAKVENLEKLSVLTSVNEDEAKLLSVGDQVKIETASGTKSGAITSINPTLNQITKKIDMEIEFKDRNLIPGAFVKIVFNPKPKTIFVPLNSVTIENGEKTIKVVGKDMRITFKPVKTGQIIGKYMEIISGLKGNETIISSVTTKIDEGEKVALME